MSTPILDVTIRDLNLEVVHDRLAYRATEGWEALAPPVPLKALEVAIEDYRRWLYLRLEFPEARVVPSDHIEEVWRQHAEFTGKYRDDCAVIFGRGMFLDRRPYFTRNVLSMEEEDLSTTRGLWTDVFGEVPASYENMVPPFTGWGGAVVPLMAE